MTTNSIKNEQLNEWHNALGIGMKRMSALYTGLTREQFNFKPSPDRWSVGQCIEHLNITMRVYLDIMEPVIEKAGRKSNEPYVRGPFAGRFLIRALRKPNRRYPAPGFFKPGDDPLDPGTVREAFIQQARRMQKAIGQCDGQALGKITMPWPVLKFVKISLAQAFELQTLHIDRHLKQAEHLTLRDDFPGLNNINGVKTRCKKLLQ